jgi:lysophospholipase L1-like esterase
MVALQASRNREQMAERLASEFHVPIDSRDRLEVVTELRSKGVDAVPSVIPRHQLRYRKNGGGDAAPSASPRILPLGGISNKVTVLCNENGQYVTYESDEHGFRNPKGLWESGRIDIVALGDSFTQGYCVSADKYFVDIVRQHYPATLNLGMAGKGALLMLAALREYAAPLRPRLVLWTYFEGNDLLDLQDEQQSEFLRRYLDEGFSQNLLDRQAEADRALRSFVDKEMARAIAQRRERKRAGSVVGESLQVMKLPVLRSRLGLLQSTSAEEQADASVLKGTEVDLFREILSRARASVQSWDGTLYFVYLPNWTRYDKRLHGAPTLRAAESQRDNVLKAVGELGIPIIDVLPVFDAHRDPMSLFPFGAPGHYTEEGHRLVADEVLKAIASTGLARADRGRQGARGPGNVAPAIAARIR